MSEAEKIIPNQNGPETPIYEDLVSEVFGNKPWFGIHPDEAPNAMARLANMLADAGRKEQIPIDEIVRQICRNWAKNPIQNIFITDFWPHYATAAHQPVEEISKIAVAELSAEKNRTNFNYHTPRTFNIETKKTEFGTHHPYSVMIDEGQRRYYIPQAIKPETSDPAAQEAYLKEAGDQCMEIDPGQDHYFQIAPDLMAVSCKRGSETHEFLVTIHNFTNNWHQGRLQGRTETRAKMAEFLGEEKDREELPPSYEKAFHAAPAAATTVAEVRPWNPANIFGKLKGEKEDHYNDRLQKVLNLETYAEVYRKLDEELKPLTVAAGFDLKSMMLFLSTYHQADEQQKTAMRETVIKQRTTWEEQKFIDAFQLCEIDWSIAETIMAISRHPEANKIFDFLWRMLRIREDELNDPGRLRTLRTGSSTGATRQIPHTSESLRKNFGKIDRDDFYTTIVKKAAEFAKAAAEPGANLQELQEKYALEKIQNGARIRSVAVRNAPPETKMQDIETITEGTDFAIINGHPNMIKDPEKMNDPENYNHQNQFNVQDYEWLVARLTETYKATATHPDVDPQWCDYLIRNIAKEICDPKVTFVMITRHGKPIGIVKIKPEDDHYYMGTFYVDPDYRQSYHIGNLVEDIGLSFVPEGKKIELSVAISNSAAARHIARGNIGTEIITEGDEKGTSGPLLKCMRNYDEVYASKDRTIYTDEIIKRLATMEDTAKKEQLRKLPNGENIAIYKANSAPGENQEFVALLQKHFNDGYVMPVKFYAENDNGEPDLTQTYVVFEKVPAAA